MVKLSINLSNRWLYTFALIIGIFALGVGVYAVAPNPGHTASEVDFSGTIATLNADQVCLAGDCQTAWPSGGGVTNPLTLTGAAPIINLRESDQTLPDGLWRMAVDSDGFLIDRNSAAAGDFSSYDRVFNIDSDGNVGLGTSNPSTLGSSWGPILELEGNPVLQLDSTSGPSDYRLDVDSSGRFRIYDTTVGEPRLTIKSDGEVNIGNLVPLTMFWEICTEEKFEGSYTDEVWCGGPHPYLEVFNTEVFQYECLPFLVDIRQVDNDPDKITRASCNIDRGVGRMYFTLTTTGSDGELKGDGAFCGAICGIPLINI